MQEQTITQQQAAEGHKGKIVLLSIGVIGLSAAGAFAYFKLRKKPEEISDAQDEASADNYTSPSAYSAPKPSAQIPAASSTGFPLKRGSKGDKVKAVQQALAAKGLLSATDVIGQYGPKTEAALIKAGYSTTIDEALYDTITSSGKQVAPEAPPPPPAPIDAGKFAQALYAAATSKNFSAALSVLKLMKTTADYTAVSGKFKLYFLNGVRQTLVNGMLSSFASADQKTQIRQAFLSMGLKYDGSKFTLSGLNERGVMTHSATTVYDENLSGIPVPANMVLGTEAGKRGHYTQFKNKGRHFLVPTAKINYL